MPRKQTRKQTRKQARKQAPKQTRKQSRHPDAPPPAGIKGTVDRLLEVDSRRLPECLRAVVGAVPREERGRELAQELRDRAARFYHSDAGTARRIADRALAIARLTGDPTALGWGHRARAEAFLFSGRMRDAEKSYAEAARAWTRSGDEAHLGQLLVGRIHVLALLGRLKEVDRAATLARRCLETAGDQTYLGKLAMNMGNLRFQTDRYGEALEEYTRASQTFQRLGLRDETVIGCEINHAVALTQLDREEEALDRFRTLDAECRERGFELLEAQIAMNAAVVHAQQADFGAALRGLGQATAYFRRTGHPAFLASCLLNRADIEHQLNLHDEALELALEAAPLFGSEEMAYDQALASTQCALSLLARARVAPALRHVRAARSLFEKEKNTARVAVMDLVAAEAAAARGRWQEAARLAESASAEFRRIGLARWESRSAAVRARAAEQLGLSDRELVKLLRSLLRKVRPQRDPLAVWQLLEAKGRAHERAGRPASAARTFARAAQSLEDLRVRIPTEESKIAFLADKSAIFDRLIALESGKRRPSVEQLFDWMERSRAQTFRDRLRSPAFYLEGISSPELLRLRKRIAWLHTRIARLELGSAADRARAGELRRELHTAEESWARQWRRRREESSGWRGTSVFLPSAPPPGLGELEAALPRGWAFLGYHLGPDSALALVATREGATWVALDPRTRAKTARLADRLDLQWAAAAADAVTGGRAARVMQAGADLLLAELHRLLWAPVSRIAPGGIRRWVISPHGPVHRIPLHALRGGEGYLIENADISLTPSGRIWLESGGAGAAGAPGEGTRRAWVAGVPSEDLPGVRAEVARVSRHLRGWDVRRDLAPTRETMRTEAERCALIHLAAHGSLRPDNPAYSFVELADGPLFVHDLATFRTGGASVVLSACSSGRGQAPAGDEWIGLARGFLQTGARAVVASLWPVHETPTLELMEAFYEGFAAGSDDASALGAAMRAVRARRPHPWNWASFAVSGDRGFADRNADTAESTAASRRGLC